MKFLADRKILLDKEDYMDIVQKGFISVETLRRIFAGLYANDVPLFAQLYANIGIPTQSMDLLHPIAPPTAVKHRNPRGPKRKPPRKSQPRGQKGLLPNIVNRHMNENGRVSIAGIRRFVRRVWPNYDIFHDPPARAICIVNAQGKIIEEYGYPDDLVIM